MLEKGYLKKFLVSLYDRHFNEKDLSTIKYKFYGTKKNANLS